jgi:hypothetical protein
MGVMEAVGRVDNERRDCFHSHGGKTLFKRDEKGLHFVRAGCKGWNCARRGPCKLKRWIKAAELEINAWDRIVYLSLTMNHTGFEGLSFVEQDKLCMPVWSKFIRVFKKQFSGCKFIMAKEPQPKSGVWSINVLVDCYVDQGWLSRTWSACGGGKIVWVKLGDQGTVRYLAKYFSKFWTTLPPSFKRYSTSRGISLTKKMEGSKDWRIVNFPINLLYARIRAPLDERQDSHGVLYFRAPPEEARKLPPVFSATEEINGAGGVSWKKLKSGSGVSTVSVSFKSNSVEHPRS